MEIVLFIVFGILAVVGIIIGAQLEKKRREALRAFAAAGGWHWDPSKHSSPGWPYGLFQQGHTRYSRFHLTKAFEDATPGLEAGATIRMFEYHYAVTRSDGKRTTTHHYYFTCAIVEPSVDLGHVEIRDEHWGDKLAQAVGFDDIDLEDPDFSKRFVVKARDRKDAYDLIGPGMMQYLVRHNGWKIETQGRQALVYRSGKIKPEMCDGLSRFIVGMLSQLPRTLVNAERARRGLPPLVEAGAAARTSLEQRQATRSAG